MMRLAGHCFRAVCKLASVLDKRRTGKNKFVCVCVCVCTRAIVVSINFNGTSDFVYSREPRPSVPRPSCELEKLYFIPCCCSPMTRPPLPSARYFDGRRFLLFLSRQVPVLVCTVPEYFEGGNLAKMCVCMCALFFFL